MNHKHLIKTLANENFDFIKRHALKDYHVKGFNSILLMQEPSLSVRLYVVKPGESTIHNSREIEDNTLLIHNHGFDFQCETLWGSMGNLIFSEGVGDDYFADYIKYQYTSPLKEGAGKIQLKEIDRVHLNWDEYQEVPKGFSYHMRSEQLHKIEVPKDSLTVMLFWEFKKQDTVPTLYSRIELPKEYTPEGLYNPFTEKELMETLSMVLGLKL